MLIDQTSLFSDDETIESNLQRLNILRDEANAVREQDKSLIRAIFKNFYQKRLTVGIGFQRAYGSILSGDFFDLIKLPDDQYMFVFADVSGHGLPAYTTLIRLRSAITLSIKETRRLYSTTGFNDAQYLIRDISTKFTDIMDESNSDDFACINFTIISHEEDHYLLRFFNRSMIFPIVLRRPQHKGLQIVNLNYRQPGWEPATGYVLGSDLRRLLGERYYETPECRFIMQEGDSLFFYSDGISEAYNHDDPTEEFGDKRIEEALRDHAGLFPQVVVDELFRRVYSFIGKPENQKDDMTAVFIGFPSDEKT